MNRIITEIKKSEEQRTPQTDKKVLIQRQHFQNTNFLDISEFLRFILLLSVLGSCYSAGMNYESVERAGT